jgi:hypothetical protein
MTRWLGVVALALAITACGVYGAPVRSAPPPAEVQPQAEAEQEPAEAGKDEEPEP